MRIGYDMIRKRYFWLFFRSIMKIKSLIWAFPVLCLACNNASTPADPASQMDASPIHAKKVAGVDMLTVDFNYDDPCNILGEEYIRGLFNVSPTTKLEEVRDHDGCGFAWSGNKILVSFAGERPYSSIYLAEYTFDRKFQGKSAAMQEVTPSAPKSVTLTDDSDEGNNESAAVTDAGAADKADSTSDAHPNHGGVTAASPKLTKSAVNEGKYEAVPHVGDKAVWDASTGAMHVLFNNHIINVQVETKGNAETKKEHAQNLAEVVIDKILENEYTRRL